MNSLGTQYSEAMQSFNQDLLAPFVESGLVASRHNSYASTVLASTPVRYYRLDDTSGAAAFDSSGNGQTGTLNGGITLNVAGLLTGDPDTAMTFNGSTGYISVPMSGLPGGAQVWSLECWIKPASIPTAGNFAIFAGFGIWGTNGRFAHLGTDSTGKPYVSIFGTNVQSASAMTTGNVYHLVGTYDGTSLRLYVNGALAAGPMAVTTNLGTSTCIIGAAGNFTQNFYNGVVDEMAIYNTALSAATITAHYSAGTTATTQVDLSSGVIVATQSDSTTRRRAISSTSFTTVTINTTYYLYAQPDGTTYWNTANTPAANSLAIAQVTTDGSGNVKLVTDMRTLVATVLPNAAGGVSFPAIGGQATAGSLGVPVTVAQALRVHVTSTSQQTILRYVPTVAGLYEVLLYAYVGGSGTKTITAYGSWYDPDVPGFNQTMAFITTNTGPNSAELQAFAFTGGNPLNTFAMTVYASVQGPISVLYTNASSPVSDNVSALIRRLT